MALRMRRSSSAVAADPFELLYEQITLLAAAGNRKNAVILPNAVVKAVETELKALQNRKAYVPNTIIAKIVSAIDKNDDICGRLEATTFGLVLDTLLHARYSRNKERGILLLVASIHDESQKRASPRSKRTKKAAIGKEYIQELMICFTNADEEVRIRRWIGILILQLLQGSDITRMAFEAGPEGNKRKLGTMVVEEPNEILRIICGQLLKALMAWDIPKKDLWPVGTDKKHYDGFPASSQNEKHWNNAFHTYIDEVLLDSALPQGSGNIYFARALKSSPAGPQITGGIINVIIDRDVSIFTQSSETTFAESLEIPFHLIAKVIIENTAGERIANSPQVDLVIHLKSIKDVLCYRNALPVSFHEIRITVQSEELAKTISDDILAPRLVQKVSQSMETITITPVLDNYNPSQESPSIKDSEEEYVKPREEASTVRASAADQESGSSVDSESVIQGSPQNTEIEGASTKCGLEVGQKVPDKLDTVATLGKQEDYQKAEDSSPITGNFIFPISTPAIQISEQTNHDSEAPAENNFFESLSYSNRRGHMPSNGNRLGAHTPRETMPEPKNADNDELIDPRASSPPVPSRQKNPTRSMAENKLKPKAKKAVLKPAVPKEKTPKVKRYSLKPKVAPIATKKIAPKASVPKAAAKSASAPKPALLPKASVSKALKSQIVSAVKEAPVPKPTATLVPKGIKKATTKSLVTKNPPLKTAANQSTHQPPSLPSGKDKSLQDGEAAHDQPTELMEIDLDNREILAKVGKAETRSASRLSAVLAVIDETEQMEDGFWEQVHEDQPVKMASDLQSSPSSLSRRTPQALEEAGNALLECGIGQVTPVQIQILDAPAGRRRSPRLTAVRAFENTITTQNDVPVDEPPLFDDHLARKTPLVSFGAKGPRNQGVASSKKSSIPRRGELIALEEPERPSVVNQTQMPEREAKRKREIEHTSIKEDDKRQKISMPQKLEAAVLRTKRQLPLAFRDTQDPGIEDNPAALRYNIISGSQGSRVDENGSPRGFSNNFQKRANYMSIAEKVLMDLKPTESNEEDGEDDFFHYEEDEGLPAMNQSDERLPPNFPTILSSSMKPRPLSPDPIAHRYVAHKKSTSGLYLDIGIKEATPQQGNLVDPFFEKGLQMEPSSFAQRLRHSRQTQTHKSSDRPLTRSQRRARFTLNDDLEATLVNVENEIPIHEQSLESDETSDGSNESRKIHPSAIQVDQAVHDEWRMALKPHQRGILEALHQVSNDLVRYLISHERAIEDVLEEYQTGGTELVAQLEKDHQDDKRRAYYEVDRVMRIIAKEYRDSKQQIQREAEELKRQPLRDMEKEWLQKQDQMERLIEESIKQCR